MICLIISSVAFKISIIKTVHFEMLGHHKNYFWGNRPKCCTISKVGNIFFPTKYFF